MQIEWQVKNELYHWLFASRTIKSIIFRTYGCQLHYSVFYNLSPVFIYFEVSTILYQYQIRITGI